MIFFVANDGTVISSEPSPVYQGAVNTNNIYLVAPFAENLQASVAFKLPNGVYTKRYPMSQVSNLAGIVDEKTGKTFNGWQFTMPNEITQYFGTVTVQFFFYAAQGGVITATSSTSFVVNKGVPSILAPTPSEDVYEAILSNLSLLSQQLNNGAFAARAVYQWNSTYVYGAGEITYYADFGQYGAFVKSLKAGNQTEPFVNGVLNSENWQLISDFNILTELYGLKLEVEGALAQSQENATAAAGSASAAESAMSDAQDSATAAQEAAESIKASADYLESIKDGTVAVPKAENTFMAISAQSAETATNDSTGNNIASQFLSVNSDIQGLRDDITNESHFRGMFESLAALRAAYPTATPNDYAYIVGGNIYIWQNNAWTDSGSPSPNTSVPASNSTPLMDGTASAGSSAQYARGDHRHPADTTKVNKSGDTMTGSLNVNGDVKSTGRVDAVAINLAYSTPFIDFHYNNVESEYSARLICDSPTNLACKRDFSVEGIFRTWGQSNLLTSGNEFNFVYGYDGTAETLYINYKGAETPVTAYLLCDGKGTGNKANLYCKSVDAEAGVYDDGQRVYSPNNKPSYTRDLIGQYTATDDSYINVGSLEGYDFFEIEFTGQNSRKISTGLCYNSPGSADVYFSCFYTAVGGIRGRRMTSTMLHIQDVDGGTTFILYGIKIRG